MDSSKILKQKRLWNKQRLDTRKPKRHLHQKASRRKKAPTTQYWNKTIATDLRDWSLGNMYEEVDSPDTSREISNIFCAFVNLAEDVVGRHFTVDRFSEMTQVNRRSYLRLGYERSEVDFRIVLRETTPLSDPEIWLSLRTEHGGQNLCRDQTMRIFRAANTLVEYLDAVLSDIIPIPREIVSVISAFCNELPTPHEECRVSVGEERCPYRVCTCPPCGCAHCGPCECPSPQFCVCYRVHGIQCKVTSSDARNALFLRDTGCEMAQLAESLFVEDWDPRFGEDLSLGWVRREKMMDLMDFVCCYAMDARVSTTRIKLSYPEGQSKFVECLEERLRLFEDFEEAECV